MVVVEHFDPVLFGNLPIFIVIRSGLLYGILGHWSGRHPTAATPAGTSCSAASSSPAATSSTASSGAPWCRILKSQGLAAFQIFFHVGARTECLIHARSNQPMAIEHRSIFC